MGKRVKIDQIQSRTIFQRFSLCPVVKQVDVFNVGRSDNRTSGFTDIRLSGGNLLKDKSISAGPLQFLEEIKRVSAGNIDIRIVPTAFGSAEAVCF